MFSHPLHLAPYFEASRTRPARLGRLPRLLSLATSSEGPAEWLARPPNTRCRLLASRLGETINGHAVLYGIALIGNVRDMWALKFMFLSSNFLSCRFFTNAGNVLARDFSTCTIATIAHHHEHLTLADQASSKRSSICDLSASCPSHTFLC